MPSYAEYPARQKDPALVALFQHCFAASEGPAEGATIAAFVTNMLETSAQGTLALYVARAQGELIGCAIFSQLELPGDPRKAVILSPMAIASEHQGRGIGQALLRFALDDLRQKGTDIAMTYGDPAFYGKTGFAPVSEQNVPAPLPLSFPQGWIGQSLTGMPIGQIRGPVKTVPALEDPKLW